MQQSDSLLQLAQAVTNFLEPLFPYVIIGTKKAAEEAGKKVGYDVWEKGKNLWGKLCSREKPELKEAAGNMAIISTDAEVRQVFTQEILKLLEEDSNLSREIASLMKDGVIQRVIAKNSALIENVKQNSSGTNKVYQEVIADGSIIKGVEQTQNARQ